MFTKFTNFETRACYTQSNNRVYNCKYYEDEKIIKILIRSYRLNNFTLVKYNAVFNFLLMEVCYGGVFGSVAGVMSLPCLKLES